MHICMSSQQKNLVYPLWQEVPKLVYIFWTCKPVCIYMGILHVCDFGKIGLKIGVGGVSGAIFSLLKIEILP